MPMMLLCIFGLFIRAGKMDFKVWGAMKHWKVLSATMVGWQEKVSNSRGSRIWLKQ